MSGCDSQSVESVGRQSLPAEEHHPSLSGSPVMTGCWLQAIESVGGQSWPDVGHIPSFSGWPQMWDISHGSVGR